MHVIDFHTHIFPPELIAERDHYRERDRWFGLLYANPRARMATVEDLLHSMERAGVATSVAFGFAFQDQGLCRLCNDYVLDAARRFPGRVLPMAVTNPCTGPRALADVAEALSGGAIGIGELMPDGQGFRLDEVCRLDALMDLAQSAGALVMLHVNEQVGHDYAGKGCQGPHDAYALAQRHPHNVLVLAHWGGGLPFYEMMPEARAVLRNVYYDTAASPFLYDDAVFRHVIAWAPTKVLLGSDYPLIRQTHFLAHVQAAGLHPEGLEMVLGGNAAALLDRLVSARSTLGEE
ncbi:MAG: amidohydrolase family protein [Anaerolineae bacterium]